MRNPEALIYMITMLVSNIVWAILYRRMRERQEKFWRLSMRLNNLVQAARLKGFEIDDEDMPEVPLAFYSIDNVSFDEPRTVPLDEKQLDWDRT